MASATVSTCKARHLYKFDFKFPDNVKFPNSDSSECYIALDISHSMKHAIGEVKAALKALLQRLPPDSNVRLYTFETFPHFLYAGKINKALFTKVESIRSKGGTDFTSINTMLAEHIKQSKFKNISIIYFTDGRDGRSKCYNPTNFGIYDLQKSYLGKNSRIFSIGFTSSHDAKFIGALTSSGTQVGLFQYLEDIVDIDACIEPILGLLSQAMFNLKINDNLIQHYSLDPDLKSVCGTFVHTDLYSSLNFHIETDCNSFKFEIQPEVTKMGLSDKIKISTEAIYGTIRNGVAQLEKDKNSLKTMNTTIKQAQEDLQALQKEIRTRGRLERKSAMKELEGIHPLIDKYFHLSRQVAAGNCNNDVLAQLNEIGYSGQLKAGLQRKLDARAEVNVNKQHSAELKRLELLKAVPQITTDPIFDDMRCFLTCLNASEAYSEGDSLCFTFDCGRSSAAVADPSKVVIKRILPSFITSEGFLDAAKMAGAGSLGDFDKNSQACVIRGEGREIISGALPLYISIDNWKMAKLNMAPILGLITTCDPLGYSYGQINALYFNALYQAKIQRENEPSDWINRIYKMIHVTCEHILRDYKEIQRVKESFENFKDPINRTIDVIPCLRIFAAQVMTLAGMNEISSSDPFLNGDFMKFMVEEQHRRSLHKNIDHSEVNRLIKNIFKFNAEDYYLNDLRNDQAKFDKTMGSKNEKSEELKYEKYFYEQIGIVPSISSENAIENSFGLLPKSKDYNTYLISSESYDFEPITVFNFTKILGIPQPELSALEHIAIRVQNMFHSKNADRRSAIEDGSFHNIINSDEALEYLTQICRKVIGEERNQKFDLQHTKQNTVSSYSAATLFCMTDNLNVAAGFLHECRTFCTDDKPSIGKNIYMMLCNQKCPHAIAKMRMLKEGKYHYDDGTHDVTLTVQYDWDGTIRTWSPRKSICNKFYRTYFDECSCDDFWMEFFQDSDFGGIIRSKTR
eukprot:UC4_evm1s937